jgi:hypothetical protein
VDHDGGSLAGKLHKDASSTSSGSIGAASRIGVGDGSGVSERRLGIG